MNIIKKKYKIVNKLTNYLNYIFYKVKNEDNEIYCSITINLEQYEDYVKNKLIKNVYSINLD